MAASPCSLGSIGYGLEYLLLTGCGVQTITRHERTAVHVATVLHLNVATLALVDEVLRLPTSSAANVALTLLYGRDLMIPEAFLGLVGSPGRVRIDAALATGGSLATLVSSRLRASAAWRDEAQAAKAARALGRARYRQLQAAFVNSSDRVAPEATTSLVRYTYGTNGRHWLWTDVTHRLLDRVVALNRAALALLAGAARGGAAPVVDSADISLLARQFDLPPAVLDMIAEALPPVALPDFARFAELGTPPRSLGEEESIERYQLLFAEMLGLTGHSEVSS